MRPHDPDSWEHRWRTWLGIVVALTVIAVFVSVVYFVTNLVYSRIGLTLPPLVAQLINTVLGILLLGSAISIAVNFFKPQQREMRMGLFNPIIEAMNRIAKGDFTVRIEDSDRPERGMVNELVRSVNNMALELNQMELMRQEFISNVSHEIQSPLTSIRGFARALRDESLSPEERAHYLGIIVTESTRLSRLTENLLALAALDSDRARFEPKPYRLDKQLRNLILACEPQWTEKDIDMDVSLAELSLTADEDLLSQVWTNLLHNSIKFTPDDGRIAVELCQQGGIATVKISDSGIGIAEADQARIFERFYKADKSRDRSKGGSGLGLAIAKKIVEMHKGTISVQSRVGEGTTFVVELPVV